MKTILIGGGGHALSLMEILTDIGQLEGYADLRPNPLMPIAYLGTDEEIQSKYSPEEFDIHVTFVYTSEVSLQPRRCIIERYKQYHSHTFCALSALVTTHSVLDEGCAVMEKAVVNRSQIGKNTVINTGAIIEHGCEIGDNCFIGPGATICGGVSIGENTFIGAGTVVRDEVSIAPACIIGMGSLVTSDITEAGVYYGRPAKIKKRVF